MKNIFYPNLKIRLRDFDNRLESKPQNDTITVFEKNMKYTFLPIRNWVKFYWLKIKLVKRT